MTKQDTDVSRSEYHLQQFIKQTERDEQIVLLDEYDLLSPDGVTAEGVVDVYRSGETEDVQPDGRFEEIAVEEARRFDVNVVSVDTVEAGPDRPDVEKNVKIEVEHGNITAEFQFVKERSDHVDIQPVTEEWYKQAVETIMGYNFDSE